MSIGEPIQRVLQFTDPHLFADTHQTMRGVCTYETFRATLAAAQNRHWPPDAILVTGDIAQDESAGAYINFLQLLEPLGVPVYCLPGNHDNPTLLRDALTPDPFQYCGVATLGGWRLPMLSTHLPGEAAGQLATTELAFLDDALRQHADAHALVCLHHHPVPSGSRWLDTVSLRNGPELLDLIARHENVRGLLWGHVHQPFESQQGNIRLLGTPSTCAQFLPHADRFELDPQSSAAYRWLALHPDGQIETGLEWIGQPQTAAG